MGAPVTLSRDNRELLRVGLVGVGPGSTLSDRILLTLLDDLDAAEAQVAAFQQRLDRDTAGRLDATSALLRNNTDLRVQLAAALAVLREVEWGSDIHKPNECPSCGGNKPVGGHLIGYGHFEDCALDAALRGAT